MTPNERIANKLLSIFANMALTYGDLSRIAFYVVQNARPHDEMIARFQRFAAAVNYQESKYREYNQDGLF